MKKTLTLLALLPMFFLFSQNAFARKVPTNKELRIGITQEFENFNIVIGTMMSTTYIYRMVGRALLTIDEHGKYVPQLLVDIPTFKNGKAKFVGKGKKRKLIAHFEIKPNAKWGDGTPVTGHDVKFAWDVARNPKIATGEKEVYTQVEKIDINPRNPKKFSFLYGQAKWDFNRIATFYILPKHLEEPVFKKFGNEKEGYSKNSLYTKNPTHPGLYCGPYRVSEVKLGSHVVVIPNKHFYGDPAKIQKIILKLIPNTGTLEANLRSGQIDMVSVLGMTFDQALAFDKKVKKEKLPYEVKYKQSLTYEHIDLNLRNPILQDVRVRKALVYAIDRDQLSKALFEGLQHKAIHNLAPIDPWYTKDKRKVVLYRHSRRKAKKLLDEAGWKPGKDGVRTKNGKRLELSLMTTAGNKTRELVQQYLQNEWKKVGVGVQIKNEPARVFFGETVHKAKYSAMAMYAWISSPENTPRSTLHTKSIPMSKNGFSGQNSGGWSNPEVDQLIDKIDLEFNDSKRLEMVHRILHLYTDEIPVIPLYYRSEVAILPKNMEGHALTGTQFCSTNHVERWELK